MFTVSSNLSKPPVLLLLISEIILFHLCCTVLYITVLFWPQSTLDFKAQYQ